MCVCEVDPYAEIFFSALSCLNILFSPAGRSDRVQMRNDLSRINSVITEHTDYLAPYQFLTAFSQLISRICHSHDGVFRVLMEIIAKVFLAYPQQAMWMMTAVSKVLHQSPEHLFHFTWQELFNGTWRCKFRISLLY